MWKEKQKAMRRIRAKVKFWHHFNKWKNTKIDEELVDTTTKTVTTRVIKVKSIKRNINTGLDEEVEEERVIDEANLNKTKKKQRRKVQQLKG